MSAETAMPGNTASTFLDKCCVQHLMIHVALTSMLRRLKKVIFDSGLPGFCATFHFGGRPYPMTGFPAATSAADRETRLSAFPLRPARGWAPAGISRVPELPWIGLQSRLLPRVWTRGRTCHGARKPAFRASERSPHRNMFFPCSPVMA